MKIFAYFTFLVFSISQMAFANNGLEYSTGVAVNSHGEVVYIEKHTSTFEKGKLQKLLTEYTNTKGKKFGSINSDFIANAYVPNYIFVDSRHGRSAGVQWAKNDINAFAKEKKDAKIESKSFKFQEDMVAGQGLHNYLRENLNKFKANSGLKEKINFLIPMNQDTYSFRIRQKELNSSKGTITLRIEADSWLFRMIAPHIDVTYNLESNRLIEYNGPSNLLDSDGDKMNVVISYKYQES